MSYDKSDFFAFVKDDLTHQLTRPEMYGRYPFEWEAGSLGVIAALATVIKRETPMETTFEIWRQERAKLAPDNPNRLLCEITEEHIFEKIKQSKKKIERAYSMVFAGMSMLFVEFKSKQLEEKYEYQFPQFQDTTELENNLIRLISGKYRSFCPKNLPSFQEFLVLHFHSVWKHFFIVEDTWEPYSKYAIKINRDANTQSPYSFYDDRNFRYKDEIDLHQSKRQYQNGIINIANTICPELKWEPELKL